ncbi:MAG: helix-turn-helix transcriptional regulator [Polyangiales bacterium]
MQRRPSKRDALYERPEYTELLGRVAANVRRLREARGWAQDEAADRCLKMGTLVYASVERAEDNFTALTLARLTVGLGVDVRDLFMPAAAPQPRRPGRPRKAPLLVEPSVPSVRLAPERPTPDDDLPPVLQMLLTK